MTYLGVVAVGAAMSRSNREMAAGKNRRVLKADFLCVGPPLRMVPLCNTLEAQARYVLPLPFTFVLAGRSLAKKPVFTKVAGQGPNVATIVFKGVVRAFGFPVLWDYCLC